MITIRGRFEHLDGSPASGVILIQPLGDGWPNPLFWAPPAGGPAVTNAPVEARLDTGGRIEVALTWPSSSGIGRYRVTERLDGTPPRWWDAPLEDGDRLELMRPR